MTRPRWRISAELLPVMLVLACLAGSTVLVIATHKRYAAERKRKVAEPSQQRAVERAVPMPVAVPPASPPPPPLPPPPADDPTPEILDRLAAETTAQRRAAEEADRRAGSLERARRAALADAHRWRQREMLVRAQADSLEAKAQQLETDVETAALERDVLARQRDQLREKLQRDRARAGSSFAVLPYRGPNGTWQRPISIECLDGTVKLQPGGPTFTLLDLDEGLSPRSNAFIAAVAHEMLKVQGTTGPDGSSAVPYILFLVRPDGIRPYYEARARLEPLGINFGYELVDQGLDIDYPDLNDPAEWQDAPAPQRGGSDLVGTWPAGGANSDVQRSDGPAVWPLSPSRARARGSAGGSGPSGGSLSPIQQALEGPPTYGSPRPPPLSQMGGGNGGPSGGGLSGGGGLGGGGLGGGGLGGGGLGGGAGGQVEGEPIASGGGAPPPDDGRVEIFPHSGRGPRPAVIVPPSRLRALAGAGGDPASSQPRPSPPDTPEQPTQAAAIPGAWHAANAEDRPISSGTEVARTGDSVSSASGNPGSPSSLRENRSASGNRPADSGPASDRPSSAASPFGSATGIAGGSPAGSPLVDMSNHSGKPASELPMPAFSEEPNKIPERVLELVIQCTAKGVVLQPGGYRLSTQNLKAGDGYLVTQLRQMVLRRRQMDPDVFWLPRLRVLVEPGGESTYWEVRKQTALAGTGWPVSLQLAEADRLRFLEQERRQ